MTNGSCFYNIFSEKYVSDAQKLHEHVLRLNHDSEENGTSINCMKISFDHEYPLNLSLHVACV